MVWKVICGAKRVRTADLLTASKSQFLVYAQKKAPKNKCSLFCHYRIN